MDDTFPDYQGNPRFEQVNDGLAQGNGMPHFRLLPGCELSALNRDIRFAFVDLYLFPYVGKLISLLSGLVVLLIEGKPPAFLIDGEGEAAPKYVRYGPTMQHNDHGNIQAYIPEAETPLTSDIRAKYQADADAVLIFAAGLPIQGEFREFEMTTESTDAEFMTDIFTPAAYGKAFSQADWGKKLASLNFFKFQPASESLAALAFVKFLIMEANGIVVPYLFAATSQVVKMIVGHGSLLGAKGIDDADRIEPIMLELYGYDLTETTTPAFSDWLSAWLAIPTHRATIVMKVCTMIALETIVRLADGSPSQVVRVAFAQVDENNRPTASVLHWDCRQIRAVNGMVAFELTRPNQFNGSPGILLADLIELSKEELISIKQEEFGREEAPAAAHARLGQL